MMEIEVKGHSGCQIDILREGKDLFIYKSSYDKHYLSRLVKQANKQEKAFGEEYQHIRVPQIYEIEKDNNHVSVKMEYVYSRNFIDYFETAGFEQIDYFIKALILFVEKELKNSPIQEVQTSLVNDKFLDVINIIENNPLIKEDEEINLMINKSKQIFYKMTQQPSIEIPVGICHGDLTFSNILFNGNNYYLIDFLDSFIESPLLDVVKIRQDSFHLWSQLMYVRPFDALRLKIICRKIDKSIHQYFERYEWYNKYYSIFQLLNLFRILQYAKRKDIIQFLKNEIHRILEMVPAEIKKIECKKEQKDGPFSLIVPVAADDESKPEIMPYVFSLDDAGIMLCIRSINGLNLEIFDDVYFTILRKHVEKFCLHDMFDIQLKRLGIKNAHLVILDKPTKSQTETVYQTIRQEHISGGIFIKDADGFFKGEIYRQNGIAIFPLENMPIVNPRNKSYVLVDDMYYITNVIEKKIIGHYFNAGGSCFEDVRVFVDYYEHLAQYSDKVYVSHIIYQMLIDKYKFRPIEVNDFTDWGNKELLNYYKLS